MGNSPQQLVDHLGRPLTSSTNRSSPSSMRGSYKNSSRDRMRHGDRGPIGSNNAHHDSRTLEDLIRDCTQLGRNDYLVRAIMNSRTDHVVGDEVRVESRTTDDDWNRQAEEMFSEWAEEHCDLTGQQTLTEISMSVVNRCDDSGGILSNKVVTERHRHCRLEMIDVIRLMNPGRAQDSKYMHGGVEISTSTNKPIAYHIADWNDQGTMLDGKPVRYDASNILLINNHRLQGAGQHRTPPRLASSIDRFENMNTATKSTWKAFILAAFSALAITRNNPEGVSIEDSFAQSEVQMGNARSIRDAKDRGVWKPGSVMEFMPGESITQLKPEHPVTGFSDMLWTELQLICAEQGLPLELVFMRFIKNYSASRSAIAVAWKKIKMDQQALIRRFLRPVYRWFIANEQLMGRLPRKPLSECYRCEFIMPTMPVMDLKYELDANVTAVSNGFKLHETALIELGGGKRVEFLRKHKIEQEENAIAGIRYGKPEQTTKSVTVVEDEDGNELETTNA